MLQSDETNFFQIFQINQKYCKLNNNKGNSKELEEKILLKSFLLGVSQHQSRTNVRLSFFK